MSRSTQENRPRPTLGAGDRDRRRGRAVDAKQREARWAASVIPIAVHTVIARRKQQGIARLERGQQREVIARIGRNYI
ncbi:MAG TPA: hypothetical protein PLD78_09540 [Burkholderiaceae bacterium]|nr:hypothetical protein [Burkholderiaceae bacterium]